MAPPAAAEGFDAIDGGAYVTLNSEDDQIRQEISLELANER